MKKTILAICIIFFCVNSYAQTSKKILTVLENQRQAWNRADIDAFMRPYWKNDSLMFIGKSGVTYGWQKTLENYKKNYPDTAAMGNLLFDILQVKKINSSNYFVVGKWFLKRSIGDVFGHFTLWFRKINKQWIIVADHSS
jgi:ketosteroid isomerase-like protein